MKTRQRIVNPRQQPARRHYTREREEYGTDEEEDFYNGVDYITEGDRPLNPYRAGLDLYPGNEERRFFRDETLDNERFYTPSFDYGYERDEYYPPDPARANYRRTQTVGYGNDHSLQGRDFEDWLDNSHRYRNYRPDDETHFRESRNTRVHNRNFEAGLYDYRDEQLYQRTNNEGPMADLRSEYRHDDSRERYDRRYNRSGRHPVIVTPFKRSDDYGRNRYNETVGFGSNEMVFDDDDDRD